MCCRCRTWIRSSNGNPFNDNSVDYIYAAHFLEHVPHDVKAASGLPAGWAKYTDFVQDFDGFFVFFQECWRILKPNSLIHIRVPFGVCYDALCDPTHTRRIVPGSFGYLTDNSDDQPFDYGLTSRFEMEGNIMWRLPKDQAAQMGEYTDEGLSLRIRDGRIQPTGFDITLRAVKDG
jgi:hypothetical protein